VLYRNSLSKEAGPHLCTRRVSFSHFPGVSAINPERTRNRCPHNFVEGKEDRLRLSAAHKEPTPSPIPTAAVGRQQHLHARLPSPHAVALAAPVPVAGHDPEVPRTEGSGAFPIAVHFSMSVPWVLLTLVHSPLQGGGRSTGNIKLPCLLQLTNKGIRTARNHSWTTNYLWRKASLCRDSYPGEKNASDPPNQLGQIMEQVSGFKVPIQHPTAK